MRNPHGDPLDDLNKPETTRSLPAGAVMALLFAFSGLTGTVQAQSNNAPVFSDTTLTLSIDENTAAGEDVGAPVTATDGDGNAPPQHAAGDGGYG